jgi:pre-mRNA-processing factor SLU7
MLAVYLNNHTQIWGSWYDVQNRQWGYACCHSTIQASYCTGEAGIEAAEASSHSMMLKMERARIEETKKRQEEEEAMTSRSKRLGEGDVQFDQERLARALKEERKRKADEGDEGKYGDKRRKYNSAMDVDVTEEDLGKLLSQTRFCT